MLSFSFKNKPSLHLVFDIRDSSVTLAAAKFEKNKKPELVLCQNFPIKAENENDQEKYLAAMFSTLDEAILTIRKSLVQIGHTEKIEKHFFFIGSPWSVSQSKSITVTKDRPFEITNTIFEKIITGEETETEKSMRQDSFPGGWQVLEEKILETKLGGYVIENIFGKKTDDLAVELFVSFIPSKIKNKLYSIADAQFGKHEQNHVGSSILPSYSFLRDAYPDKDNFICADIGDYLTDIYVVRDNVIFAVASMPFGEKDIVQSAAKKTKTSESIVSSSIAIHRAGNDNGSTQKDFETNIIGQEILVWLAKIGELLSKMVGEFGISKNLFIIPRSELSRFIAEYASSKEHPIKVFEKEMEVFIVDDQVINDAITNAKVFENEPGIKIDLLFLNRTIG